MKFTDEDKQYLLEKIYGNDTEQFKEDLPQIERAADVTAYEVMKNEERFGKTITRRGAIRLLGRKKWLSGLSRSAFHWDACRPMDDGRSVYFNSRAMFRN